MGISAAVAGVGALVSAGAQAYSANKAATAQENAANTAVGYLQQNLGLTSQNLSPFITAGTGAVNQLVTLTGSAPGTNPMTAPLTAPFQPTMAQLSQTPGYQFTLNQGLKSVQNSNAAKGLGASGEALAGGANYAEGLASTTYQNQFQNYLAQNQQIYNMLSGLSGIGSTAATNLGQIGAGVTTNIGSATIGAGNAQAAGINAIGQAVSNVGNAAGSVPLQMSQLNALQGIFANGAGTAANLSSGLGTNTLTNPGTGAFTTNW